MSDTPTSETVDWRNKWGDASKVTLPDVGLKLTCMVAKDFNLSVIQTCVKKTQGGFTKKDVNAWVNEAVRQWYETYRNDRAGVTAERQKMIQAWVPGPDGSGQSRLDGSLEGVCKDREFAKLLHNRYGGNSAAKKLAISEAVFEAIERTLQE